MRAPKLPSLFGFKAKGPDQFYYEPRYYDERKEKMKQRYERIGKEIDPKNNERLDPEEFRSTLRDNWGSSYSRSKAGNQVNRRVIFYVLALLALAYYILF